jgi:hypothetical protein
MGCKMKKANELGDVLNEIDASVLLFSNAAVGGASSCGGKCYQGCKATTLTPSDMNMPNVQPSSSYRKVKDGGVKEVKNDYKGTVSSEPSRTYKGK